MIRISRGLNVPIGGAPEQSLDYGALVRSVGLVGDDYVGLKPGLAVREGDEVKLGQLLFEDKKTPGVRYTSPGCGKVLAINRGAKRKFESIQIQLDGDDEEQFTSYDHADLRTLSRQQVLDNLVASGLWTSFRTRPYGKVPSPASTPHSIFVTAMDTSPLAADPAVIVAESRDSFADGLRVVSRLTEGTMFLCASPAANLPGGDIGEVRVEEFDGPHPAGLPGTHIHFLDPVSDKKTVWYLNYEDVIAIGKLFRTGRLDVRRVVALGGPGVKNPRLLRTRVGADLDELTAGELSDGEVRVISGSVLCGRRSAGPCRFLGRYHLQVSCLEEERSREFMGWAGPGWRKFSIKPVFASAIFGDRRECAFTTSLRGEPRAMVPIGMYEKVMPLDILPTFLLRALIVGDTAQAQSLGCLELDEEDLGLCTFVCPGKYDYGPILRENLTRIEVEG
ncbi:MAG: Na(+)-translocating NADH-quinone reductase subunit A [Pirellulaceae bacterium]